MRVGWKGAAEMHFHIKITLHGRGRRRRRRDPETDVRIPVGSQRSLGIVPRPSEAGATGEEAPHNNLCKGTWEGGGGV